MKSIHYVVMLIVRRSGDDHQLLMVRRADGIYMGGTWQLVTGSIEPNETAWQAALREMQEETGLLPTELYRLSTLTSFYRADNDSLNTAPMFCAVVSDDAAITINWENTAFEWVNVADAEARLMWPSDRQALSELRTVIIANGIAKEYMRVPLPPSP